MIGWLAVAINVTGLLLLGQKMRVGWLFGAAAEFCWLIRASDKQMPDLLVISTVYIAIAVVNFAKWRKQ